MRIAHVRERNAPAGADWRLAAALNPGTAGWTSRWPAGAPSRPAEPRPRQRPAPAAVTTLDDHLARGLRVETLADLVDGFAARGSPGEDDAVLDADDLAFGPPILRPPSFRDFYAFERHVRTMWERRARRSPRPGTACRSSTSPTCRSCAGQASRSGRPGVGELDYELEVGALIDTPAHRPRRRARRGGDRRLLHRQRLVRARPPARRERRSGWGRRRARTSACRSGRGW